MVLFPKVPVPVLRLWLLDIFICIVKVVHLGLPVSRSRVGVHCPALSYFFYEILRIHPLEKQSIKHEQSGLLYLTETVNTLLCTYCQQYQVRCFVVVFFNLVSVVCWWA